LENLIDSNAIQALCANTETTSLHPAPSSRNSSSGTTQNIVRPVPWYRSIPVEHCAENVIPHLSAPHPNDGMLATGKSKLTGIALCLLVLALGDGAAAVLWKAAQIQLQRVLRSALSSITVPRGLD